MTTRENHPTVELDDLDWWTGSVAERDQLFAWLRSENPRPFVQEQGLDGNPRGRGFWALTRFDDIREVSRRPEDFCSGEGALIFDQSEAMREYRGSIITMDDPRHVRTRKIVSRGFTPRALQRLSGDIERTSREILGSVAERGTCDFVTDVAALIPLRIVNNMMGVPGCYEQYIFDQTNIILGASDAEYVPDQSPRAVGAAVFAASKGLTDLLAELARERIKKPQDDVISALVAAQDENLTPQELAAFFILLISAGNETTRNAISHGLRALTLFPEQRALWQSNVSGYAKSAVEEIVRWASPVLHMRRTVTTDGVRLGDQEFVTGDKVVLWYRSANQDEQYFSDPTQFDILRSPNPHLGYGAAGPHFCLGANLARLELSIFFKTLFATLPDIRSVGEPQLLRSNFLHGVKHLRAEFTPLRRHRRDD
jgi:cytochrome P450